MTSRRLKAPLRSSMASFKRRLAIPRKPFEPSSTTFTQNRRRVPVVDRQESKLKNERSDGADAFIPESDQTSGTSDDLAELLAEQYLREASGDELSLIHI